MLVLNTGTRVIGCKIPRLESKAAIVTGLPPIGIYRIGRIVIRKLDGVAHGRRPRGCRRKCKGSRNPSEKMSPSVLHRLRPSYSNSPAPTAILPNRTSAAPCPISFLLYHSECHKKGGA